MVNTQVVDGVAVNLKSLLWLKYLILSRKYTAKACGRCRLSAGVNMNQDIMYTAQSTLTPTSGRVVRHFNPLHSLSNVSWRQWGPDKHEAYRYRCRPRRYIPLKEEGYSQMLILEVALVVIVRPKNGRFLESVAARSRPLGSMRCLSELISNKVQVWWFTTYYTPPKLRV